MEAVFWLTGHLRHTAPRCTAGPRFVVAGLALERWPDPCYISREAIQQIADEGGRIAGWFDACGPQVLYETPAKRLIADPATNEVFGVLAEDASGNPVTVKANKGVLLASGGFLGNEELVHRFGVPRQVGMVNQGAPTCTGDGLLVGLSVGAALKNLNFWCLELNGLGSVGYTKAAQELVAITHSPSGDAAGARIIVNERVSASWTRTRSSCTPSATTSPLTTPADGLPTRASRTCPCI